MKRYNVWHESKCQWMSVDDEWMDGVKIEGAKDFSYSTIKNGTLIVTYENGDKVSYQNVHGTWGFPTVIK